MPNEFRIKNGFISEGSSAVTGSLTVSGSLGVFQSTPTSRLHLNFNQNSTTQADTNGILLANSTAATAGAASISPPIVFQGNSWTGAASQDVRFRMDVLTDTSGNATWRLFSSTNGGSSYNSRITMNTYGDFVSQNIGGNAVAVTSQLQSIGNSLYSQATYRTTANGSNVSAPPFVVGASSTVAGSKNIFYDVTNGLVFTAANSGATNRISRAAIDITNLVNTAASESADLAFQTQRSGSAMTTKMTIGSTGNVSILSGSLTVNAVTASFISSGSNSINLSNSGSVRIIGNLFVTGSITATDNVIAYSDESIKENVNVIPNALNKVLSMRGVTYTRIDTADTERIHAGVIAQEIEKSFPEVVYSADGGKKAVAYGNITSILIEAIKEQQKQIDDLRKQIEKLT